MAINKYPSLIQYYKTDLLTLDTDVVATEKVHGTSARFGHLGTEGGKIYVGSRNQVLDLDGGDSQHFGFVGFFREKLLKKMKELGAPYPSKDIELYGEWYGSGIMWAYNGHKEFMLYGVRINGDFQPWDMVEVLASYFNVQTVPLLYRGPFSNELFNTLKEGKSVITPTQDKEGIVISPYVPRKNQHDEWLILKLKPAKFDEIARAPKAANPVDSLYSAYAQAFVAHYVTANRLEHVIQHLREAGESCKGVSDVGKVLKEMAADVQREGSTDIPSQVEWKVIHRLLTTKTKKLYTEFVQAENLLPLDSSSPLPSKGSKELPGQQLLFKEPEDEQC
jgi:hypothetical protein